MINESYFLLMWFVEKFFYDIGCLDLSVIFS